MDETIFTEDAPLMCVCGDIEDNHADGVGPCFVLDCQCKEFEEKDNFSDMSGATEGER